MQTAGVTGDDLPFRTLGSRALSFTIPALRVAGFVMLSGLVAVHAIASAEPAAWRATLWYGAITLAYSVGVWALLWRLRSTNALKVVASRTAEVDLAFWAYALVLTGGGDSWLFPLMTLRAADHLTFGQRRVLVLGHLSTIAFFLVLFFTRPEGLAGFRAYDWGRLSIVYGINLYLSWAAAAVDRLNARLRQTRDSLVDAKIAAEQSSRSKSAFLAAMSHELRTPLNAIIGYAELIREDFATQPQVREDLGRIEASGRHLLGMVNDILDVAKIDAGRMDVQITDVDLSATAREMARLITPIADGRGLALEVDAPEAVWVRADAARLRQVLLNLLSNACKFTERGGIRISVPQPHPTDAGAIVDVTDTGIGMSDDQLSRIFDEFVQVDDSPTRRHGGAGLGLALTRRFCDLMHGSVNVVSAPGQGSTFTVRLPRGVAPQDDHGALTSHEVTI